MRNELPSDRQLIHSCQGLVRSIAWKIHQRLPASVELDDLIGYGQIGLAEAARDFDPDRNIQFTTYAYYRIRGAVLDGLSRMSWFNRADFSRGRYESAANDVLTDERNDLGSAEDAGWFTRTTRSLGAAFILTHFMGGETDVPEPSVMDETPQLEVTELHREIREVVDELPEQERMIIRGVYFEGLSIKEAGERLEVGKAWASRLHARALELMSHRLMSHADPV
ncbi:MAG: sigma-70 family RNA polymerase sigma factor [Planctomycetaceae bacterium]|nr:sigma-70 family RNA polymerase sigma factor [Planctomycetaceae bacterium]